MARYALAASAALIALALAAPAAAKPGHVAALRAGAQTACPIPAAADESGPDRPQLSESELEDKIDQLTETIADLTDRLASLEDAIDPDGDDGLEPDDELALVGMKGAWVAGHHRALHSARSGQPPAARPQRPARGYSKGQAL
jgi:hypothetical protein